MENKSTYEYDLWSIGRVLFFIVTSIFPKYDSFISNPKMYYQYFEKMKENKYNYLEYILNN